MDPEEAFERSARLVEAYLDLRLEFIAARIEEPLSNLPGLCKSENPRLALLAKTISGHVEWMRTWFPECSAEQLVHMADLISRAFYRQMNRSAEDQFVRLVAMDIGTIRARVILDQLDQGRIATPRARPVKDRALTALRQGLLRNPGVK